MGIRINSSVAQNIAVAGYEKEERLIVLIIALCKLMVTNSSFKMQFEVLWLYVEGEKDASLSNPETAKLQMLALSL